MRSDQQFVETVDVKFNLGNFLGPCFKASTMCLMPSGFVKQPKRFNVALTRPKALLIVIGNPDVLQSDTNWGSFIRYCRDNGACTGTPFTLHTEEEEQAEEDLDGDFTETDVEPDDDRSDQDLVGDGLKQTIPEK